MESTHKWDISKGRQDGDSLSGMKEVEDYSPRVPCVLLRILVTQNLQRILQDKAENWALSP